MVALAASACSVAPAAAGEYEVWSCRGPAGQPLSTEAWVPRESDTIPGEVWVTDDCATGGPVTLDMTSSGTGTREAQLALNFDLPRGAQITDFRLRRAIRAAAAFGPPFLYVSAVRETSGGTSEDWGCASVLMLPNFNCSFDGAETDPDDPTNVYQRTGVSLDGLATWIGCYSASGCNPPFAPPAARFVLFESVVTIADNVFPVVQEVGGTLTGPDPIEGSANLFVRAVDKDAGVASMELEIDGAPYQVLDVNSADCVLPYEVPRPCPADAGRVFTVDTSALADGNHVATGSVTDAAGNETAFGPVSFSVDSPDEPGPPSPDNGVPAVNQPALTLGSGTVTHKPGTSAEITGRLITDAGVPVAGAVLKVDSTQLAVDDASPAALPDAITGSDGTFSVPVPGEGARRVEISFAPSAGVAPTAVSAIRVGTTLSLALKARPKKVRIKKKVTFVGRLTGAGPSAAGAPVEVQAKVQGRWETVATVSARADGTFKWAYRFRYVKRRALFSFRAVVRKVPGWPWPNVASKTVKVRITMGRR